VTPASVAGGPCRGYVWTLPERIRTVAMELRHGGVSHPVPSGGGSLGSGEGAWLRLQGTGVLPEHARVRVEADGLVIVPAAPEAVVVVNGAPVGPGAHLLADGDRIGIGAETVTVGAGEATASPSRSRPTPPPGAAEQLADTLAGVPSFRPPTPPGSIRSAAESGAGPSAGKPPSGGGNVVWVTIAVVVLGVVLYLLLGR